MVLVQRKVETIQEGTELLTKLGGSGVETWIARVLSDLVRLGKTEV